MVKTGVKRYSESQCFRKLVHANKTHEKRFKQLTVGPSHIPFQKVHLGPGIGLSGSAACPASARAQARSPVQKKKKVHLGNEDPLTSCLCVPTAGHLVRPPVTSTLYGSGTKFSRWPPVLGNE